MVFGREIRSVLSWDIESDRPEVRIIQLDILFGISFIFKNLGVSQDLWTVFPQ